MAKITSAKITRTGADGAKTTTTATPVSTASAKSPAAKAPAVKTTASKPAAGRRTARKPKTATKAKTAKPAPAKTKAAQAKAAKAPANTAKTKAQASADIQSDLRKLEARLKRADTVTRKSVTALQTVVSTLDARLNSTTTAQKGLLSRHVNALSAQLDDQTAKTRDLVRQDLKLALSQGGLDRLEAAVAQASARIDAAELAQADAVTKLNRHLADMARAVDARIAQEASDRARDIQGVNERLEAAITETRTDLGARVDGVERDSAEALTRVGETIEQIHDRLETRRQSSADVVTEKVNELALQTQAEFEAYQAKLEARIADLEGQHHALSGVAETAADRLRVQLEQQLIAMQSRIDGLEREAAAAIYAPTAAHMSAYPDVSEQLPTGGQLPIEAMSDAMAQPTLPAGIPANTLTGANDANPYAAALPSAYAPQTAPIGAELSSSKPRAPHEPVEFDPNAYASSQQTAKVVAFAPAHAPAPAPIYAPHVQAPQVQAPTQAPVQPPAPMAPTMPPMPVDTARTGAVPTAPDATAPTGEALDDMTKATLESFQTPQDPDFLPAPLPEVPYANPAYADEGSPKAVRIGEDSTDRRKRKREKKRSRVKGAGSDAPSLLSRLPITPRNAKLGLLMVGVSAVGLFAAKSILGTEGAPNPAPEFVAQDAGATPKFTPQLGEPATRVAIVDPSQATVAPIGQYEEARALKIDRAQLGTLTAAVEAGDPIAQFQLGVAKLETAEDAEGAELIRMAADQDLAVALYQLGKLHETGRGVDADPVRARQLIERAARSGNRIAMHDLALYHTEGRGGAEQSMLTARSWFEQAAQRGVVDSQFNLAVLSESSQSGLTPNTEDAYFWYTVAAAQGDKFATDRLQTLDGTLSAEAQARIDARVAAFKPRSIDETANGIFRDVPWLAAKGGTANRERTLTAQTLLAQLGFEVGTPDGIMGAKTRAAITEFERMNGLTETGEVSSALIGRLELATGA